MSERMISNKSIQIFMRQHKAADTGKSNMLRNKYEIAALLNLLGQGKKYRSAFSQLGLFPNFSYPKRAFSKYSFQAIA